MSTTEDQYAGIRLDSIEDAITAIREGKSVVVVDDEDRENEGDLIFAAQRATTDQVAFMIRWTSGYICVGMPGRELDRLHLPPMTMVNEDRKGTAYAITVDAKDVKATGISAEDRARTIKVLADTATVAVQSASNAMANAVQVAINYYAEQQRIAAENARIAATTAALMYELDMPFEMCLSFCFSGPP